MDLVLKTLPKPFPIPKKPGDGDPFNSQEVKMGRAFFGEVCGFFWLFPGPSNPKF